MKNNLFLKYLLVIIITIIVTIGGYLLINVIKDNLDYAKTEEIGIKNITEIDTQFPNFTLIIKGAYNTTLKDEDLASISKYEIEAVISDGVYNYLNTYKEVKLSEVLAKYKYTDYSTITFRSTGSIQVRFTKDEITNNLYLVYEKNGKNYQDNGISIFNPSLNEQYSLTNIIDLTFEK